MLLDWLHDLPVGDVRLSVIMIWPNLKPHRIVRRSVGPVK